MHILSSWFTDFFCGVFTWCTGVHGRAGLSVLITWRMGCCKGKKHLLNKKKCKLLLSFKYLNQLSHCHNFHKDLVCSLQ